jgi:flagellum-specific peptidoglycan hydrolase FlgJ
MRIFIRVLSVLSGPSSPNTLPRDFKQSFIACGSLSAFSILLSGCQMLQFFKPSGSDPNLAVTHTADAYINRLLPEVKRIRRQYGIPMDLTLAIAIQETGYGKSVIGQNNHFGLKCKSSDCVTISQGTQTTQWENCANPTPCFDTFALTIERLAKDDFEDLSKIRRAGYATSPDWTQKVSKVRQSVRNVLKQARKTS